MRVRRRYRGRSDSQCERSFGTLVRAVFGLGSPRGEGARSSAYVSERFPVCKAKEVVRVLRKHGFAMISQKGSHRKWRHANGRQSNCGLARQPTDPDWQNRKSVVEGK